MAIPKYHSILLPLLKALSDQQEHRIRDLYEPIADQFHLTAEERQKLLPSGKARVIRNRVQWAKVYLLKACLISSPERGRFLITQRGLDLLSQSPTKLDHSDLKKYAEFREFLSSGATPPVETPQDATPDIEQTPEEVLEDAYANLRAALADELLQQVKSSSPTFFERLVIDLLVAMGYGGSIEDAGQVLGRSGDGGIDGIIKEDRLGLDVIYVQAKRWDNTVGRPEIQKFVGALQGHRSKKGVFITTAAFSKEASGYASSIDSQIVLVDGVRLAQLMIDFNIGVSPLTSYVTKRLDTDYFSEE